MYLVKFYRRFEGTYLFPLQDSASHPKIIIADVTTVRHSNVTNSLITLPLCALVQSLTCSLNELSPWSTGLHKKPIVPPLADKFHAFRGTRKVMCSQAPTTGSCREPDESIPHPLSLFI